MTEILVPTLGESVTEATVATWFKAPGEPVNVDEMICELETDKVTVEVPSPVSGILKEISATEGTTVGLNALLAIIDEHGANERASLTPEANKAASEKKVNSIKVSKETEDAPSARKIMREKNITPSQVSGTGRDGRIMKEDVKDLEIKRQSYRCSAWRN